MLRICQTCNKEELSSFPDPDQETSSLYSKSKEDEYNDLSSKSKDDENNVLCRILSSSQHESIN